MSRAVRPAGPALLGPRPAARLALVVPEGVGLELELGSVGERAYAFVLDLLLLLAVLLGGGLLLALALGGSLALPGLSGAPGWLLALGWLLLFVLRTGWFLLLEVAGRGRTPGKRAAGLRVVDASGAPLGARALVARNLLREVELWLPLSLLAAPESVLPDAAPWVRVLASLWTVGLALFPLLHPTGARLGDLAGGTRVVRAPRVVLLPDLAESAHVHARAFSTQHLSVYGELELAALERALRMEAHLPGRERMLVELSRLVRTRTGWAGDSAPADAEPFLRDFYAAQRRHLEERLRRGERKRDKHHRA